MEQAVNVPEAFPIALNRKYRTANASVLTVSKTSISIERPIKIKNNNIIGPNP